MPDIHTEAQLNGAKEMLTNPITIINCPSRRSGVFLNFKTAENSAEIREEYLGRTDYAANAGDQSTGYDFGGPESLTAVLTGIHKWQTVGVLGDLKDDRGETAGVSFQRSEVGVRNIEDGTTHTYLCGERFVNMDHYDTGQSFGDDQTWCTGANNDNYRTSFNLPEQDRREELAWEKTYVFGSAHASNWNVAYCDGHVESVGYDVDIEVHRNRGNRADGNTSTNASGAGS